MPHDAASTLTRAGAGALTTAPIAAGGLLAGFAAAVATDSRPLGGVVLVACGALCARTWWLRHGPRRAFALAGAELALFAGSHALGPLIGAWPAVLAVSAAMGAIAWRWSDRLPSRRRMRAVPAQA